MLFFGNVFNCCWSTSCQAKTAVSGWAPPRVVVQSRHGWPCQCFPTQQDSMFAGPFWPFYTSFSKKLPCGVQWLVTIWFHNLAVYSRSFCECILVKSHCVDHPSYLSPFIFISFTTTTINHHHHHPLESCCLLLVQVITIPLLKLLVL